MKRIRPRFIVSLLLTAALTLPACGFLRRDVSDSACTRMRTAVGDFAKGRLSVAQYREELQAAYDDAKNSDNSQIKAAARELLRNAREKDFTGARETTARFFEACRRAGFLQTSPSPLSDNY